MNVPPGVQIHYASSFVDRFLVFDVDKVTEQGMLCLLLAFFMSIRNVNGAVEN
jgi:hypothetical protein